MSGTVLSLVPSTETRHQLRAPIRSRLTYLKEGARYGARSDIRRACRKTTRRYLPRNYECHPYLVGSPPHPASLGQTSCERPKRCWVEVRLHHSEEAAPF